jgi:hypothetical protein
MPNYAITGVLGVNLGATAAAAEHTPGEVTLGANGSQWIYVKAGGAIAQYDYVCIDEAFTALAGTKANVDAGHAIGFAQAAFASGEYGWVALQGRGTVKVNVLASCAADAALYSSATAGKLDDDSTSQTAVPGVVITSSNGGSTAAVECIATFPRGR